MDHSGPGIDIINLTLPQSVVVAVRAPRHENSSEPSLHVHDICTSVVCSWSDEVLEMGRLSAGDIVGHNRSGMAAIVGGRSACHYEHFWVNLGSAGVVGILQEVLSPGPVL